MHTYEKDFRYLLQYLVPHHRLPPEVRRDVERVLASGSAADLRRVSVTALESLVDANYLTRGEVTAQNGDVIVPYRRVRGRYQVRVAVPRAEWPLDAPGADTPATPAVGLPPARAVAFLPEIIRSFTLTDRTDPVLDRLETLLETLGEWMDLRDIALDVLDEAVGRTEPVGRRVRIVDEDELRGPEIFRAVLESGARRLVSRAESLPGVPPDGTVGVAPIFHMGKVDGVLRIVFADGMERSTMDRQLEICASVVRQVIEFHEQFETLTSIDALTGIYNRHFFDRQLPVEVERAMRSGSEVSMLVLDIDDFKKINDELGHRKGDEALSVVADLVRENLRKVDTPFRYGGEEIVILLPGTSEVESVHTAERLRRVIAHHQSFRDLHGQPRQITVSIGVSVFPDTARSADALFVQADAAMYRAKQLGKNRVVLYKEDMDRTNGAT